MLCFEQTDFLDDIFCFQKYDREKMMKKVLGMKNKKISYYCEYIFIIMNFSEVSNLLQILNTYNKRHKIKQKYEISCSFIQLSGEHKYKFTIYLKFRKCTILEVLTCLFIILNIVPLKLFSKINNDFDSNEVIIFVKYAIDNLHVSNPIKKNITKHNIINNNKIYGTFISEDDDDNLCVICFENNKSRVLKPCDHYVSCDTCTKLILLCPICRVVINEVVGINCSLFFFWRSVR